MPGFHNNTCFAGNVDFSGQTVPAPTMTTNAQLLIGTTSANAGGTHINVGILTSPNNTVTIGYSSPNITLDVVGGSAPIETITGNSGGPEVPSAGNFNILGTGSITVAGTANTETVQLTGLTSHALLVGAGTETITKVGPTATAGQVLQSGGSSADPAFSTASYPAVSGTSGNVITSNGTNFVSQVLGPTIIQTTFTGAGTSTWTINPRSVIVEFFVWGGGGGGGGGRCGASLAAAGGSGGGGGCLTYVKLFASALTSGSPYTVTVGDGGTGGLGITATTTNGNPGNPGGNSAIGTVIVSSGGTGGLGGMTSGNVGGQGFYVPVYGFSSSLTLASVGGSGAGAVGGSATNLFLGWDTGGGGGAGYQAVTANTGGVGGNIIDTAQNILVAGGTAGANTGGMGGDGNSPSGLVYMVGGTGGGGGGMNGTTLAAGNGGKGAAPSGGGGGGAGNLSTNTSGTGGKGGAGQIIIIEYF